MKRLLLAAVAVVAFTGGSATAADIAPSYKAPPPPRPACAQFGGFYIGGNVGAATYDWTWNDRDSWARNEFDGGLPDSTRGTKSGFIGGLQGGWNWQSGCTVFGIETDWSWASIERTREITDGDAGAALDTLTVSNKLRWLGTTRTRAGVVVDNLLLYVTGGLAYARFDRTFTAIDQGVSAETFSSTNTRWGWVAGVGTEWALWNNWSLKSEALYVRFQESETNFTSAVAIANGNGAIKRFDHHDSAWIARVGLNWRFGGGLGRY